MTAELLDLGVVDAAELAATEDAVASLLDTTADVLLVQAEAIVALEATAKGLAQPGMRALNVVTGPYGALFGRWLAGAGADVSSLEIPYHRTVSVDEVSDRLNAGRFDLVAVVHAEAATGGANPIDQIAPVVHRHGALLVVDAVASVGAHPVEPDRWPADVVVIGGQKALAGPAGVSALSISERAWKAMADNPFAPRESILSLLDLRDGWLRTGRRTVLGTPSSLESRALGQAAARVLDDGLPAVIGRHTAAARATRAGLRALDLQPWIEEDGAAAHVVTTIAAPASVSVADLVTAARSHGSVLLGPAPGSLSESTLRINHTGRAARLDLVLVELVALGRALGLTEAVAANALETAEQAWG